MITDQVIVVDEGPVRLLRLNRPDKKNALTDAMYEALAAAIEGAETSSGIHCIVIAGQPGAFTTGADLRDFAHAAQHMEGLRQHTMRFLHCLANVGKPLVAAVQGIAIGIGTTLLLHCDYVVAATDARFAAPFVALGLVPEAASSLLMPRLMGPRRAFEILVMGRPFDAATAKSLGLVNAVVAPDQVDAEAIRAAHEIAALPVEAVAASRRLIRGPAFEIARRIDEEATIFQQRLASSDARAAFEAFLTRKDKSTSR